MSRRRYPTDVAGALLTSGIIISAAFRLGNVHGDGGMVVVIGFLMLLPVLAGLAGWCAIGLRLALLLGVSWKWWRK